MEKSLVLILASGNMFKIAVSTFFGSSDGLIEESISILQLMLGDLILSNFQ
jgi:hypothetical protein